MMPTGHGNDRGAVKVRSVRHNGPDVAEHVQHLKPDVRPRWGVPEIGGSQAVDLCKSDAAVSPNS